METRSRSAEASIVLVDAGALERGDFVVQRCLTQMRSQRAADDGAARVAWIPAEAHRLGTVDSVRTCCRRLAERCPDSKLIVFLEGIGFSSIEKAWRHDASTSSAVNVLFQCVPFGLELIAVLMEFATIKAAEGAYVIVVSNNKDVVLRSRRSDVLWRHQGFMCIEADIIFPGFTFLSPQLSLTLSMKAVDGKPAESARIGALADALGAGSCHGRGCSRGTAPHLPSGGDSALAVNLSKRSWSWHTRSRSPPRRVQMRSRVTRQGYDCGLATLRQTVRDPLAAARTAALRRKASPFSQVTQSSCDVGVETLRDSQAAKELLDGTPLASTEDNVVTDDIHPTATPNQTDLGMHSPAHETRPWGLVCASRLGWSPSMEFADTQVSVSTSEVTHDLEYADTQVVLEVRPPRAVSSTALPIMPASAMETHITGTLVLQTVGVDAQDGVNLRSSSQQSGSKAWQQQQEQRSSQILHVQNLDRDDVLLLQKGTISQPQKQPESQLHADFHAASDSQQFPSHKRQRTEDAETAVTHLQNAPHLGSKEIDEGIVGKKNDYDMSTVVTGCVTEGETLFCEPEVHANGNVMPGLEAANDTLRAASANWEGHKSFHTVGGLCTDQDAAMAALAVPADALLGAWVRDGGRTHAVVRVPGPSGGFLEFRPTPAPESQKVHLVGAPILQEDGAWTLNGFRLESVSIAPLDAASAAACETLATNGVAGEGEHVTVLKWTKGSGAVRTWWRPRTGERLGTS